MKTEKRILAEKLANREFRIANCFPDGTVWTLMKLTKEDLEFLLMITK